MLIPLFTFALLIVLKVSLIYPPDFLAAYLYWKAIRINAINKILFGPFVIGLYLIIITSALMLLFSGSDKPFWPYHVARVVLYLGAGCYVGYSCEGADNKFAKWAVIWACLAVFASVVAVFVPEYFPPWLADLKKSAFWSDKGTIDSRNVGLNFRETGIYGSYLETGNVMLWGSIMAMSLIRRNSSLLQLIISFLMVCLFAFGMFLASARTSFIGLFIAIAVFGIFWLRGMGIWKLTRLLTVLMTLILVAVGTIYSNMDDFPGIEGRIGMLDTVFALLLHGENDSSFEQTLDTFMIPDDPLTLLLGNSLQAWYGGGVSSDMGYIQILWGTGIIGLIFICLFYATLLMRSLKVGWKMKTGFSVGVIAILMVVMVMNVIGLFMVGIRSGDFAMSALGVLLGYSQRHRIKAISELKQ